MSSYPYTHQYPLSQHYQQPYVQPQQQSQSSAPYSQGSVSASENGNESQYAINTQRYGNPLAHSSDWAPNAQDSSYAVLPKIDFSLRVKQRFARSAGDPFNPPAVSFARQPGRGSYSHFDAFACKGEGKLAGEGFKPTYPGNIMTSHDVSAADWQRFLEDIVTAGRLTGTQSIFSNVAPVTMHMGATGFFVTKAIEKGMRRRKEPLVFEVVETWQQRFFGPRRLDIYVQDGNQRMTGRAPGAPIPDGLVYSQLGGQNDDSSSDDSDSSDDEHGGQFSGQAESRRERKAKRKAEKRARKSARRQEKRERKTERRERKKAKILLITSPLY